MGNVNIQFFKSLIQAYKENFFRYNYIFFSISFVIGLSTGEIIMSVATISLVVNWILEGGFKQKLNLAKEQKYIPYLLVFSYLSLVFWMFNSSDWSYGLRDLKIKLPILFFPLVLGTVKYSKRLLISIFQFFIFLIAFFSCSVFCDPRPLVFLINSISSSKNLSGESYPISNNLSTKGTP